MNDQFAITEIAHPGLRGVRADCPKCLRLAPDAVSAARVTGSIGGTYQWAEFTGPEPSDRTTHSATVRRIIAVVE